MAVDERSTSGQGTPLPFHEGVGNTSGGADDAEVDDESGDGGMVTLWAAG